MIPKLLRFIISNRMPMIRAPKIDFAMITITYPVIDGEGAKLNVTTWAIGTTAKKAFRSWLRSRPEVMEAAYTIVTESHWGKVSRFEPLGERVEVSDTLLRSLA